MVFFIIHNHFVYLFVYQSHKLLEDREHGCLTFEELRTMCLYIFRTFLLN